MKYRWGFLFGILSILVCFASFEVQAIDESAFLDMLTESEKQYVEEAGVISTIISPNKGPIQYLDKEGVQRGITSEVLEEIASFSNLTFHTLSLSGLPHIQEAVDSGHAQIVAGIPIEQTLQAAYRVNFSETYMGCMYGIILHRSNNLNQINDLTLALATGLDIPEQFQNVKEIKRYDSIQACIDAVLNKEADFAFGNSYVLEFYSQGYKFQNLCVIPLVGEEQEICFGVSQTADPRLVGILNKALDYMGSEKLTNILIKNVSVSTQPITIATLISANPLISVLIGMIILLVIIFVAVLLLWYYRLKSRQIRLEHQHYLMISEVSNEYFYEYYFKTDTMTLSEDAAELFGCKTILHKWHDRPYQSSPFLHLSDEQIAELQKKAFLMKKGYEPIDNNMEVQLPLKDGVVHWFQISQAAIYESRRLVYVIGKMRDVQKEHLELDLLTRKSLCDSLTGIYHTEAAKRFVNEELQKQHEGAFFIIDLDYFKRVNDYFGHQVGDKIIRSTAAILKKTFREQDIVGRLGGDEFIVFAPKAVDTDLIIAKCIQMQALVKEMEFPQPYCQTISIGVARATAESTFDQLYSRADEALYLMKENGRNGYHIAD